MRYKYMINGYLNYYHLADDLSRINYIMYIITYSAAHTLASKTRNSLAKIFRKYGKTLTIDLDNGKKVSLAYD